MARTRFTVWFTASLIGSLSIAIGSQGFAVPQPNQDLAEDAETLLLSATPVATPTTGIVTIESDRQIADNGTGIVTAIGNVRILYPDRRVVATARQAQYFSREGRVVLSGDVDVIQADGHSIRAEQLVYLVEQERLEAKPALGQQVISHFKLNAPFPSQSGGDQ